MQIVFGIWTSSGFFCFVFLLSRITLFSSAASFFLISFLFGLHPSFLSVFHHFPISSAFSHVFSLFLQASSLPLPPPHSYFIFILFASFPLLLDFLCLSENLLFTRHRHLPLSRADTPSLRPPFPPSPGLPGRLCLLGECYYSIALHLDNHRLATPNWSEWGRKKEGAAEER